MTWLILASLASCETIPLAISGQYQYSNYTHSVQTIWCTCTSAPNTGGVGGRGEWDPFPLVDQIISKSCGFSLETDFTPQI